MKKMNFGIFIGVLLLLCVNYGYIGCAFASNDALFDYTRLNSNDGKRKCERITVPMCRNMDYNLTSMPNQFNHETQEDAAVEIHQFWALVEINCAKELRFLLCSMYTPICIENYPQPIKACKSVCERAKTGCEKYMLKYGFEWPEHMNCDHFPEYGSTKEVCMDPNDAIQQSQTITVNNLKEEKTSKKDKTTTKKTSIVVENSSTLRCLNSFNKMSDNEFGGFSINSLTSCTQSCRSPYFNESEQTFAYYWILFWTILCFLSAFCTAITYLIDKTRFNYPEKPIIYLCICYLFVSTGYIMKYMIGHENVACELDGSIKQTIGKYSNSTSASTISCTLIFLLIYYFGMASSVWWVIVSLTWFLAAGLKWGIEAISKYNRYFHLIAWILPGIQTLIILSMGLIDADSLSGICYVGNTNVNSLRVFVLVPSLIYLSIGIAFLLFGFISLFRIRSLIKQQQGLLETDKLEKLMLRIGIFSILYTVPATCLIACYFYEQNYRYNWETNLLCNESIFLKTTNSELKEFCTRYLNLTGLSVGQQKFLTIFSIDSQKPAFSVFLLKYFMSLIVGVTSGFWIWTGKTIIKWRQFMCKKSSTLCDTTTCFKTKHSSKESIIYFQATEPSKDLNQPPNLYQFPITNDYGQELNYYHINQNDNNNNTNNTNNSNDANSNCHTNKAAAFYYDCSSSAATTLKHDNNKLIASSNYSVFS